MKRKLMSILLCTATVSYTHLDVYKRQIGYRSHTYDQSIFYLICAETYFFEKQGRILRRCNNRNKISVMYNIVSTGYGKLFSVFYSAEKDIAPEFFCNSGNTHSIQTKFGKNLKF